jgi:hypothetical protein
MGGGERAPCPTPASRWPSTPSQLAHSLTTLLSSPTCNLPHNVCSPLRRGALPQGATGFPTALRRVMLPHGVRRSLTALRLPTTSPQLPVPLTVTSLPHCARSGGSHSVSALHPPPPPLHHLLPHHSSMVDFEPNLGDPRGRRRAVGLSGIPSGRAGSSCTVPGHKPAARTSISPLCARLPNGYTIQPFFVFSRCICFCICPRFSPPTRGC